MSQWPEPNGVHEPRVMQMMYRGGGNSPSGVLLCPKCGKTATAKSGTCYGDHLTALEGKSSKAEP